MWLIRCASWIKGHQPHPGVDSEPDTQNRSHFFQPHLMRTAMIRSQYFSQRQIRQRLYARAWRRGMVAALTGEPCPAWDLMREPPAFVQAYVGFADHDGQCRVVGAA